MLSDFAIRALQPPERSAKIIYDDIVPGFGVRVTKNNIKSFILTYGRRRTRKTIGRVGVLSLKEARQKAKELLAEITLGKERPRSLSWKLAVEEFVAFKKEKLRDGTIKGYEYALSRFRFGETKLTDITPQDIEHDLDKLKKTPVMRHNAFVVLRIFFRWAYKKNYVPANPLDRVDSPKAPVARERALSPQELAKVLDLAFAGRSVFHRLVAALILTGQRRGEISALEWSWIDFDQNLITFPDTKNHQPHTFPIGPMTVKLLSDSPRTGPHVFPADKRKHKEAESFNGWSKGKRSFDKQLKIPHFVLHDFRRTLRTYWAELGILEEVAEKYINHISGKHSGIQRTYNRARYLQPMRDAVAKWEAYVVQIMD